MDWWVYALIAAIIFGIGIWIGISIVWHIWLKDGIEKTGILQVGKVTYKVSEFRRRTTRI